MSINPGLIKTLLAETLVPRFRVVKPGTGEENAALATAAGDALIGVSVEPKDVPAGKPIDIAVDGLVEIEAGAAISRGDRLTVDASGRVAPSTVAADKLIGYAWDSANAAGDILRVKISIK